MGRGKEFWDLSHNCSQGYFCPEQGLTAMNFWGGLKSGSDLPNRTDRIYPSTVVYGENQKSLSN